MGRRHQVEVGGEPATDVIGTPCLNTSHRHLLGLLHEKCREPGTTAVDFTNTHIAAMRRTDPGFARDLAAFDYFVPDSQVLFFAIRLLGGDMDGRVYGPDFLRHAVVGSPRPYSHYFLGGSPECLERLEENLVRQCPDLHVAGRHHGYFPESEDAAVVDEINSLSPDFIWVGLGTPKQQRWIAKNRQAVRRGVLLAVGFAFDVNAGTKPDAPPLAQRLGLTWLHRLASEPGRLWKRYLTYNSLFLWFLARQLLAPARRVEPAG
jgi:N-acetylglucosaminyldiphosphoundecaprenol N-acetyl-beta-D-mannosaminyltransferase